MSAYEYRKNDPLLMLITALNSVLTSVASHTIYDINVCVYFIHECRFLRLGYSLQVMTSYIVQR